MSNHTMNADDIKLAAEWIEQFEALGGFVLCDGKTITFGRKILGYSQADQAEAGEMIFELVATRATTLH